MIQETVSIAEAKKTFSELLGKVAYGKKRIIITKRGKPMALLSPPEDIDSRPSRPKVGLTKPTPSLRLVDRIVQERVEYRPRILRERN